MTPLAALIIVTVAWAGVRIVGKTGFNRWLGLFLVVPVANIALLVWLALADWPGPGPREPRETRKLPPPLPPDSPDPPDAPR